MSELCKGKYSVRIAKYEGDLVSELRDYYSNVNIVELKINLDFISHICNCIEYKFTKDKKRYKVNKKDVAISIIKKLCGDISDADVKTISTAIENLHSSGKISGLTIYKMLKVFAKNFLKKLFGK